MRKENLVLLGVHWRYRSGQFLIRPSEWDGWPSAPVVVRAALNASLKKTDFNPTRILAFTELGNGRWRGTLVEYGPFDIFDIEIYEGPRSELQLDPIPAL